jgi:hypothetical protein
MNYRKNGTTPEIETERLQKFGPPGIGIPPDFTSLFRPNDLPALTSRFQQFNQLQRPIISPRKESPS